MRRFNIVCGFVSACAALMTFALLGVATMAWADPEDHPPLPGAGCTWQNGQCQDVGYACRDRAGGLNYCKSDDPNSCYCYP